MKCMETAKKVKNHALQIRGYKLKKYSAEGYDYRPFNYFFFDESKTGLFWWAQC